jgi:hypothetical protein
MKPVHSNRIIFDSSLDLTLWLFELVSRLDFLGKGELGGGGLGSLLFKIIIENMRNVGPTFLLFVALCGLGGPTLTKHTQRSVINA